MSYVDEQFAEIAMQRQPRFKRFSGSTFKLNCRCKICGDSAKDEFMARFYARAVDDTVMVKCFNCDYSNSIAGYIKNEEPDLYRDYLLEKRKSNFEIPVSKKEEPEPEKKVIDFIPYSVRLDTVDKGSKLIQYIQKRKIPNNVYDKIYFTKEWQKLVNHINKDTYKYPKDEMRLVIPIFNSEGEIESLQGRALQKDAKAKYMTIKAYEDATKIYGLERVDKDKPVIILEGPLDSLFLPNAIAITGGSMDINSVPFKGNRIWAMDNEPRHPDTKNRVLKLLEASESVVCWDNIGYEGKDINELIINGADKDYVLNYIFDNSVSGLMGKLRISKYFKI